ncbi:hypothetical protein FDP41_012721 [Naegleria fowleri]|uniref:Uncharacterized protein n=1 Tax=Naegleria fowleri TaxID=5763 RepID=A0A6A5BSA1_NAEFO|nr:uncharacterized protein FDP41_012721 [Naegleria fowleri]KAF0980933.1 hypothetical protein FDP41_012721 [Naegleria fowleri]
MKKFGERSNDSATTSRRRLEKMIRHLTPENCPPMMEKSMNDLKFNSIHVQQEWMENSLGDFREEKLFLLQRARQLFNDQDSWSDQILKENENKEKWNVSIPDNIGPFTRLFDHFGIYLPLPLDLAQMNAQPNDFQYSLFNLIIPEISESETAPSTAEGLISKLQNLKFTQIQEKSMGYVISIYINLLKGNYENVLEQIQHAKMRMQNKTDYILLYLESLCRYLLRGYDTALLLCDSCIGIMLNNNNIVIEKELNCDEFLSRISTSQTEIPKNIRIQPLILYSWILFHLYEFSHAERVLVTCCEEIFPFNAEAHFNYAQLLAAMYGCSNLVDNWNLPEHIFNKMNSHLKQCIELYIHEDISLSDATNKTGDTNTTIINNETQQNQSNIPQSPYYSIFKYWNYYLHFLNHCPNMRTLLDHHLQYLENYVYKSLTQWYGIDYKKLLDDKSSSAIPSLVVNNEKTNNLPSAMIHPIDLAYLLVVYARWYALNYLSSQDDDKLASLNESRTKEDPRISKAHQLYRIASNVELIAYTQFNHKSHDSESSRRLAFVFYCKRLACTQMFSISREFNNFKQRFLVGV